MTRVAAGTVVFDVDAIAFDKDGTLVDLDAVWGPAGRAWVATAADGDDGMEAILADQLGLDLDTGHLVPGGMIAVGSVGQLYEATLAILIERSVETEKARSLAMAARSTAVMAADAQGQVPLGDVTGTLRRLQEAGLRLAVVSSDNRAAVDAAVMALGIRSLIDAVVAGDDGFDAKPAPDTLLEAARRLGRGAGADVVRRRLLGRCRSRSCRRDRGHRPGRRAHAGGPGSGDRGCARSRFTPGGVIFRPGPLRPEQ